MYILSYTLSVLGMLLLPVVLAGLARQRFRPPWLLFVAGMATFGLSQLAHFPLNEWLHDLGWLPLSFLDSDQPLWRTALILGLTAGLCEELARTLGYAVLARFPILKSQTTAGGLMLGLGHGGIEALVFGGLLTTATIQSLLELAGMDLTTLHLAPDQLAALQLQINALTGSTWQAVFPLLERAMAMAIHVVLSLMVLKAFQRRQPAWVILAIAYHALIDAGAVYARGLTENVLLIEGVLLLLGLPGFVWMVRLLSHEPVVPVDSSLRRELVVLGAALRKEFQQQVRTGRLVVIGVVFGLFGMLSPLIAYMTPHLMRMIPGAEAFADLIPTQTVGDAMMQYHKNLTQFGFIIVLLLGMGAVAGEKESGAAAIILSKPLTRWAYLLSKLLAQTGSLAAGLLLGMIGGYAYTAYLFSPPDFLLFGAMNLVLLAWLLPFIGLTLLGSVLGKSTPAGAGIGLAAMALLLGLSSIPTLSAIMPGTLSGWALHLGILSGGVEAATPGVQAAAGPAPAALVSALIITLCAFYAALGAFEQQEL